MENPSRFLYITNKQYDQILIDLNVDQNETGGLSPNDRRDLIDQAVGDLESDLVTRFVVPLQAASGIYEVAPFYAKQKVLNAMRAKIKEALGGNKQKNIVIDSSERYIDLKRMTYRGHIKDLLDPEKVFGFKLQSYATDGSLNPVQQMGLARPSDSSESGNGYY